MMPWMAARAEGLRALLAERILVLDGATGTYLQGRDLGPADAALGPPVDASWAL